MMRLIEAKLKNPDWGDKVEIYPDEVRIVDESGDCVVMSRGLWDALT